MFKSSFQILSQVIPKKRYWGNSEEVILGSVKEFWVTEWERQKQEVSYSWFLIFNNAVSGNELQCKVLN